MRENLACLRWICDERGARDFGTHGIHAEEGPCVNEQQAASHDAGDGAAFVLAVSQQLGAERHGLYRDVRVCAVARRLRLALGAGGGEAPSALCRTASARRLNLSHRGIHSLRPEGRSYGEALLPPLHTLQPFTS